MTGRRGLVKDNALGLAFGGFFVLTLVGQAISGTADYNAQQVANGLEPVSFLDYVTSSSFGVDVMENWQSEYLQFFLYIFATVWLVQRGSAESKSRATRAWSPTRNSGWALTLGRTPRRGCAPAAGGRRSSPAPSGW